MNKENGAPSQDGLPADQEGAAELPPQQTSVNTAADGITAQKGAENALHELNQLLLAIREINKLIVREREPQQLLAEACDLLVKMRGYALVWIGLTEPDSKRVIPAARAGNQAGYLDDVSVTWDESPAGQGPVGAAIRTRRPWLCQDTATDPRFAPWRTPALARGLASAAAVPMIQGERVLGVLAVYTNRIDAFHEEEIGLLNEVAGDLAFALESIEHMKERRKAEASLRLVSTALESAANAIAITDRAGVISWVNPAFTQLTGYSFEEVRGRKLSLLKSGVHDRAFYRQLWDTILAGRVWRAEMVNRRKDGSVYTEENTITPVRDKQGEITHFVAVKQDVSERKRVEAASRASAERFQTLYELAPDGIYLCDLQGTFVDGNKAAEELIGYARGELIGKSFLTLNLLSESDLGKAAAALARNAQGEATGPEGYVLMRKDGRQVAVEIRTFPIKIREKALVLGVARDITDRKQLETQLRQAQKMEGIGQLAGGVAHDFNNMLAVMRGNADLLLMDAEQHSPYTNECLKHIAGAAERAASLTRQLLIFSRKQAMQSEPLALNGLVQNLLKMLKRVIREDIRLECRYAAQLPFVQADPGMMEQVLLNLVVNARDAMPCGGQLFITTAEVSLDAAYVRTNPEARAGEFVCLSVNDTGTGIAPEHLQRIFEPFFTTKEPGKGTGLGLATVYGIVKQHQGWIEVSSRVGEGATFSIFLPAIPPPAKAASAPAEGELRPGSETVLLVEDDFSVRMITRRVLETFKYKVYEAACAREAVEVWQQHAGEIALLLTDIIMPEGVTGRELAEQLRGAKPGLKVIFMSGYSAEVVGNDTEFFRRTRSYFLRKPSPTATLIQTVRKCLDEKAPGGAQS